jgi:2-dehydropantoate 2-reductase
VRICVFGAGAVGGHLAARLAAAGHDVSVVARGEHLAAIAAGGIVLRSGGEEIRGRVRASDRPADLGEQDVVMSTLKAPALPAFAESAAPLLGPDTAVVFAQNGVPWWYADGLGTDRPSAPDLSALDPGGALRAAFATERVLGAVIESSNTVVAPGVVVNESPGRNALHVGEINDRPSDRVAGLRDALRGAGIGSGDVTDIRAEVWRKLLRNLAGSTLCVLCGTTARGAARDPLVGAVYAALVREGAAIARAHGFDLAVDADELRRRAPEHKPSMLQDYERGRPMEVQAIALAPLDFARVAGVEAPALGVVAPLVAHRAAARGLFQPA